MSITGSTSRHCYVIGCSNGDYKLQRCRKATCDIHSVVHVDEICNCNPPFKLFTFPSQKKNNDRRQKWIRIFSRAATEHSHQLLQPKKDHRVCSDHFVDGKPTDSHPDPELQLGHSKKRPGSEENSGRTDRYSKRQKFILSPPKSSSSTSTPPSPPPPPPSSSINWKAVKFIVFLLLCVIRTLKKQNQTLNIQNIHLKNQILMLQKTQNQSNQTTSQKLLKKNGDAQFYTGLDNLSLFTSLHNLISPFVRRRWRGFKCISTKIRKFSKSPQKFGPERKLKSQDEFLLTLMWLRLGLLKKDLADRFQISQSLCSQIFNSWLTAMSKVMSHLVFWPSKEQVISSKPQRYKHLPDLRAIIDCSEIFIQTPKDPILQAATWSEYKHHNTGKFLVGVAPNSAITFVSNVYNGRASDKAITKDSGFLDLLEPYDMIQADKGFNIQDELSARLVTLQIPPGKRGQAQMSMAANTKTSRIANLRILVEQVIRRIKSFRIIKYTVPNSLVQSLDKIVKVCCALSNLKPPIYKD